MTISKTYDLYASGHLRNSSTGSVIVLRGSHNYDCTETVKNPQSGDLELKKSSNEMSTFGRYIKKTAVKIKQMRNLFIILPVVTWISCAKRQSLEPTLLIGVSLKQSIVPQGNLEVDLVLQNTSAQPMELQNWLTLSPAQNFDVCLFKEGKTNCLIYLDTYQNDEGKTITIEPSSPIHITGEWLLDVAPGTYSLKANLSSNLNVTSRPITLTVTKGVVKRRGK